MNLIYRLFIAQHPNFVGRVSLLGHSLGGTIRSDIFSRQPFDSKFPVPREFDLDSRPAIVFDVHAFFTMGLSPIGLFQY
jgi:hypothetical protein